MHHGGYDDGGVVFLKTGRPGLLPEQAAVLALPMDVEDLARLGRRKEACPYYAARAALPEADLVLLPYSALLAQVPPLQAPPVVYLHASE